MAASTGRRIDAPPVTVSLVGSGDVVEERARALRSIEGVSVVRGAGDSDLNLLEHLATQQSDAVVLTESVPDLPGAIKRLVLAGRHVLVAMPVALASKQLIALDEIAARRRRVILFDALGLGDARLPFVRKMTVGPQPLWRPRYVRSLRTGAMHGSLDEVAVADLSVVLSLIDAAPVGVSAVAPRVDDESGGSDVVFITLACERGIAVRCDVSLIEPLPRQEIVIACEGRTVVLDALDARAPLQIQASASHRGPKQEGQWAETVSEHPLGTLVARSDGVVAEFVRAVREKDVSATNARQLATASLVWETARISIARGGEMTSVNEQGDAADMRRPEMRVIRGRGRRATDHPAPELTLVKRTSNPQSA